MTIMTFSDASEVIEALREWGFIEMDIMQVIEGIEAGDYSLGDVADLISSLEEGDDDEAFMNAAHLGLA